MSEQKVPRSVEQRIVIKFLVGENVSSAEIHHRLQQQYGEECLLRSSLQQLPDRTEQVLTRAGGRVEVVASLSQCRTAAAQCVLFTHKSVPVIFEPPCNLRYYISFGFVVSAVALVAEIAPKYRRITAYCSFTKENWWWQGTVVQNRVQVEPINRFSVYVWYQKFVETVCICTGKISVWPLAFEADVGRLQQASMPTLQRRPDPLHGNLPFLSRQFRKRPGSARN